MPTFRLSPEDEEKLLGNAASVKITHARPLGPVVPPDDAKDEKAFQAQLMKEAKKNGWLAYHTHDSRKSRAGFPDTILLRGRSALVMELKVGDNKPTPEQEEWIAAFNAAGIFAAVYYPEDWATIARLLE